jgi:TRAP-type C4-dicarboxylate transport system permease small subunit
MEKIVRVILLANNFAGIILICAMAFFINIQVFYRYVLNAPLQWPEELARYLFVWITYVGLVKVVKENKHYRIDFFLTRMPQRMQRYFKIFFDILVVLFLLFALYGSVPLLLANRVLLSPAMQVTIDVLYLAFPVAIIFMLPLYIYSIARDVRELRSLGSPLEGKR